MRFINHLEEDAAISRGVPRQRYYTPKQAGGKIMILNSVHRDTDSSVQASNSRTFLGITLWLRVLVIVFIAAASTGSAAADDRAGAALLFSKDQGGLTKSERVEIFKSLGLSIAPDGKSFIDQVCGQPAGAEVEFRDMNSDKVKEVLVTFGNTCLSGMAGSSVVLFIKDSSGHYRPNLGFPAASADPLPSTNKGYPDLLIGGPGFCFPVWRWNGTEYVYLRNEPQEPGGCDNR